MSGDGTLASEIQRKTAEIDHWPAWAKPYERQTPPTPPASDHASTPAGPTEDPGGIQPQGDHAQ